MEQKALETFVNLMYKNSISVHSEQRAGIEIILRLGELLAKHVKN
jgi:hypothetical protein